MSTTGIPIYAIIVQMFLNISVSTIKDSTFTVPFTKQLVKKFSMVAES